MIQHPDITYINPLEIDLKERPAHCLHVEAKPDKKHWYFDINKYLETDHISKVLLPVKKRSYAKWLTTSFRAGKSFILLRSINATEATKLLEKIHATVCGTHMNGLTLAKKILQASYFLMTIEHNCCKFM